MNLTVREVLNRYGPALAMVGALFLLVVFIPGNGTTGFNQASDSAGVQTSPTGGGTPTGTGTEIFTPQAGFDTASTGAVAGGGTGVGSGGGSGGAAAAKAGTGGVVNPGAGNVRGSGTVEQATWNASHGPGNYPLPGPDTICRADGAMPDFSQYAPKCLPKFSGDNGGATSPGVTADKIKLVWYYDETNAATQATLVGIGAADSEEVRTAQVNAFVRHYNTHLETYGREVVVEKFYGTGDPQDDNVLRADAVAIAQNLKPFAVFHHSVALGAAFSEELAARGVICLCTTSAPRSLYNDFKPYLYTVLPVLEEYYVNIAEYVGKRLQNAPAKHAGAPPVGRPTFNDVRKFGLVFLEGSGSEVNPRVQPVVDEFKKELAKYGAKLEIDIGYQFDIAQSQAQATNVIGQLVAAGVNHVIIVGDPLYPIFLTKAATQQGYNPEWMITGTGLIDTTFFGRTYDPAQWQHAFGMSPLWVFASTIEKTSGWRTMNHHDTTSAKGAGVNVTQSPIQLLVTGVHYAGPKLTPQTLAAGLFAAPAVGGKINAPLVKFTELNMGAIKDMTEVWWDVERTGKDELDKTAAGMLVKANGGQRYQPGQWPSAPPSVFGDDPNGVTTTDLPETFDHDADGHTHASDPPCRSCG